MKESARKQAEKRAKEFSKKQRGEQLKLAHKNRNVLQSWKEKLISSSQVNLNVNSTDNKTDCKRYSYLVGTVNSNTLMADTTIEPKNGSNLLKKVVELSLINKIFLLFEQILKLVK